MTNKYEKYGSTIQCDKLEYKWNSYYGAYKLVNNPGDEVKYHKWNEDNTDEAAYTKWVNGVRKPVYVNKYYDGKFRFIDEEGNEHWVKWV